MKEITFSLEGREFIPLIQLLKAVRLVGSGGEAQRVVEAGEVLRGGEVELRKRAKIRAGETIETLGVRITVQP